MKIVITGAGGLVGKALTRCFSNAHQVLPLNIYGQTKLAVSKQ